MSFSVYTDRAMVGLTGEQQAAKAIAHLLCRVQTDDRLYHLVGLGSQAFALLTEAHSTLAGVDLAELRKTLSNTPSNAGAA
jgi:hypothetical protein